MCAGAKPLNPSERCPHSLWQSSVCECRSLAGAGGARPPLLRIGRAKQLTDERTGKVHDYTGKSDIYGSEILEPEVAPERLSDRTSLWNEVERVEKRKDAQLSREVMIALPAELTHRQKQFLTREYVQDEFVEQGMIADIGYHDFDSHNPHAHIMLTMRDVDDDGFGKKRRDGTSGRRWSGTGKRGRTTRTER